MEERVILVDKSDNEIGSEEKIKAHIDAKLHRSFSIFIFNSNGELLIQQRAKSKYHCGSLWTNTCCSHPRIGETLESASHRRLIEEMGFDCSLKKVLTVTYNLKFDNGLTENEYDHVFIGNYDGSPNLNQDEVDDWKWISIKELTHDISENPGKYTPWFRIIIQNHLEKLIKHSN